MRMPGSSSRAARRSVVSSEQMTVAAGDGPYRHRQQHEVCGGEPGHGQPLQQLPVGGFWGAPDIFGELGSLEAGAGKGLDEVLGTDFVVMQGGDAPGG